jgi:nucleoside 2-deoxyribosyltransferase
MTAPSHSALYIAALVALAALAGPGLALTGDATQEASFAESVVVEQRGDVALVTVYLSDTDAATLTVGSEDVNYLTEARVTDGDGNGVVQVRINTHLAGGWTGAAESEAYGTLDGSDGVSVSRETGQLDGPLAAGTYDMELSAGGSLTDVASLQLEEPAAHGMTTLTAPEGTDTTNPDTVLSAASERDVVATGDVAVVAVATEGTLGYIDDASDLADGTRGVSLELEETDPPPNREANRLDVSAGDLYTIDRNDILVVAIDTDSVDVSPGEEYEARFSVADENPYFGGATELSTTFTVRERTASVAGDPVTVEPESGETIRGTATHAPGTELTVRVSSQSDMNPFLIEETVTVGSDGAFAAAMDFSVAEDSTEFTVEVQENGEAVSDETQGIVDDETRSTTTTQRTTATTAPAPTPTTTALPTTAVTTALPTTELPTTALPTTRLTTNVSRTTAETSGAAGTSSTATTGEGFDNSSGATGTASFASSGQPGFTWVAAVLAVAVTLAARRRGE